MLLKEIIAELTSKKWQDKPEVGFSSRNPSLKNSKSRKTRNSNIATILLAIGLTLSTAFGRPPQPDSILVWSDCLSIAIKNNPELASSRLSLEASKSTLEGSRNGLFPQLGLAESYHGPGNSPGSSHWQTQASVNLNVWSNAENANIKTFRTFVTQALANQRQTASLLRFNLRKAFVQLYFVQKTIEVSKRIVQMRQESAQLVSLRYNSGRESKGSMLKARAQLLQAQADLSQALRDLRTNQKNMNAQLGLESFSPFTIISTLEASPPGNIPANELDLLELRPDVIHQMAVVNTMEATLEQVRSTYWPNLTAGFTENLYGASSLASGWNVVLSYPLFGNGPTSAHYSILVAKYNLEKAKQDLRSIREQAIVDIETSWSQYAGFYEQSGVSNALLEAARQRNDEANIRYNSGLMTYDGWEIIASERIDLERQVVQAQLNVLNAEAAWEKTLGKQLEE